MGYNGLPIGDSLNDCASHINGVAKTVADYYGNRNTNTNSPTSSMLNTAGPTVENTAEGTGNFLDDVFAFIQFVLDALLILIESFNEVAVILTAEEDIG